MSAALGGGAMLVRERPADFFALGPVRSVIPVVGDGRWIETKPPDTPRGYYHPRPYTLSVGIQLDGAGPAQQISASTPVPVDHPEQKIEEVKIESDGCQATIRETAPGAGQLLLSADSIGQGQTIRAVAHFKLTIQKQYFGYHKDQFPASQKIPKDIRDTALQNSPGIQTSDAAVKKLADQLAKGLAHPWDKAAAFAKWIPDNIHPQIQPYTNVATALEKRTGDCQEYSAIFIALCRSVGIPARLIWGPNHNWAEFYLVDDKGVGHWLPVDTACYRYFGWMGAHELVIQKGDRVYVPEQGKTFRLLEDWLRVVGRKPKSQYFAELEPQPDKPGADPGPGARRKDSATGEWKLIGDHPLNRYARR